VTAGLLTLSALLVYAALLNVIAGESSVAALAAVAPVRPGMTHRGTVTTRASPTDPHPGRGPRSGSRQTRQSNL
jgi:hypothetical protein